MFIALNINIINTVNVLQKFRNYALVLICNLPDRLFGRFCLPDAQSCTKAS